MTCDISDSDSAPSPFLKRVRARPSRSPSESPRGRASLQTKSIWAALAWDAGASWRATMTGACSRTAVLEHAPVIVALHEAPASQASAAQIDFVWRLARPRGLSEGDLEGLARTRFRKGLGALSESEMSQVITFLGG